MISERLTEVIRKQLGLSELALTDATLASEVPGWDSLRHLQILAAVEKEFGIKFRALEVLGLKNVGALQRLVDRKLGAR